MIGIFLAVLVCVIGLPVLVLILAISGSSTERKQASQRRQVQLKCLADRGVRSGYVSPDGYSAIGISRSKKKIIVGRSEIDFARIVGCTLERERHQITRTEGLSKTNRGSQLLGAAVGAAAFGPLGAAVGGLTGSRRYSETSHTENVVRAVYLNIIIKGRQPCRVSFGPGDARAEQLCAQLNEIARINALPRKSTESKSGGPSKRDVNSAAVDKKAIPSAVKQTKSIVAGRKTKPSTTSSKLAKQITKETGS